MADRSTRFSLRLAPCLAPLALWLLPQLLIFLIGVCHVPLWLGVPMRMDNVVLAELLCVQIITAALLFPVVLRSWESAAAAICVSWPMIAAAAFVSSTPLGQWLGAGMYVSLLLAGLGIWNRVLLSDRARLIGAGAAAAATLGGLLLAYLQAEFSATTAPFTYLQRAAAHDVILGALAQLQADPSSNTWWLPWIVLLSGVLAWGIRRASTRRGKLEMFSA